MVVRPLLTPSKAITPCKGAMRCCLVQTTDSVHPSILSFLLVNGAWDNAGAWAALSDSDRASIKSQYDAAGIKLMVSAFGSTDVPVTSKLDPVTLATTMGNWVKKYGLDGIDVDFEVEWSRVFPFSVFG